MRRVHAWHQFLLQHSFYPLLLATVLAGLILLGRFYLTNNLRYSSLAWNLFLAWVPYLCALSLVLLQSQHPHARRLRLGVGVLWLLFFPNAPYIMTDFVHLLWGEQFWWWYEVGLISTFAWTGFLLGITSLRMVQHLVRGVVGEVGSWFFVALISWLSGLGIYLGRFLRLNSWDLFTDPLSVIITVGNLLLDPVGNRRALGMMLLFATCLFVAYVTLVTGRLSEPWPDPPPPPDNEFARA